MIFSGLRPEKDHVQVECVKAALSKLNFLKCNVIIFYSLFRFFFANNTTTLAILTNLSTLCFNLEEICCVYETPMLSYYCSVIYSNFINVKSTTKMFMILFLRLSWDKICGYCADPGTCCDGATPQGDECVPTGEFPRDRTLPTGQPIITVNPFDDRLLPSRDRDGGRGNGRRGQWQWEWEWDWGPGDHGDP